MNTSSKNKREIDYLQNILDASHKPIIINISSP